jgi:hypothetical protein
LIKKPVKKQEDLVNIAGFKRQVQHPRIWQKPQQESCILNTSSALN